MYTPEQLKGKIRNIVKEKNLSSQEILCFDTDNLIMNKIKLVSLWKMCV